MNKEKCPKCKELKDMSHPALSRDNKTNICEECGTREALEEFAGSK